MNGTDYYTGRKIVAASINDERLVLAFKDGTVIEVFDDRQACCEYRHMSTDDDVQTLVGGVLWHIEDKAGPSEPDGYNGEHETQFIEVATDKGFITLTNHNEHNGYYGGFNVVIREKHQ